jgi:LMBR1-like membrane protein
MDHHGRCDRPLAVISWHTLFVIWRIQYYLGLTLTYLVVPFLMNYSETAEFTVLDRVKHAIKKHLLVYGTGLVIAGICLIVLAVQNEMDGAAVEGVILALSNGWGLFLLVCLLGFGLEQVPRLVWRRSNAAMLMKHYQYRAGELSTSLEDAGAKLTPVLRLLRRVDEATPRNDPYRAYVDRIVGRCLKEYAAEPYAEGEWEPTTYAALVSLHESVLHRVWKRRRTRALLGRLFTSALNLEDKLRARAYNEQQLERGDTLDVAIPWRFKKPRSHRFARALNAVEYYWFVFGESRFYQLCALLAAVMSAMVIWSEATLWSTSLSGFVPLSPFHYIIESAGVGLLSGQLIVFVTLAFIAGCAFFSLFRLRLFDYYRILPHHQTDSKSLLFSAAWLCRLILPLTYNFLVLIDAKQGTAFDNLFGSMGTVAEQFSVYFPIAVVLLVALSYFDAIGRILSLFGVRQFQFRRDFHDEHIDSGREILDAERARRLRALRQGLRGSASGGGGDDDLDGIDIEGGAAPLVDGKPAARAGKWFRAKISSVLPGSLSTSAVPVERLCLSDDDDEILLDDDDDIDDSTSSSSPSYRYERHVSLAALPPQVGAHESRDALDSPSQPPHRSLKQSIGGAFSNLFQSSSSSSSSSISREPRRQRSNSIDIDYDSFEMEPRMRTSAGDGPALIFDDDDLDDLDDSLDIEI